MQKAPLHPPPSARCQRCDISSTMCVCVQGDKGAVKRGWSPLNADGEKKNGSSPLSPLVTRCIAPSDGKGNAHSRWAFLTSAV